MAPGRVAVVGAGLAGLSAAVELRRLGYDVEIFERSQLLGGKATSFTVGGVEVDNGQHVFLGCCTEWLDFVRELGLGDHLHIQPRFEVLLLSADQAPLKLRAAALPSPCTSSPSSSGTAAWAGGVACSSFLFSEWGSARGPSGVHRPASRCSSADSPAPWSRIYLRDRS
jgi:uncharacterized protein with NAD-binding domain and iron-sulfur cluster